MNLPLESIMHAQFPIRVAIILVLAPFALSLLVALLVHSRPKNASPREEANYLPATPDRSDESRPVLPKA